MKQAQKHMGHQGILIRDASLFEGLNERYCRVAIRLREDNERLTSWPYVNMMSEFMQERRASR